MNNGRRLYLTEKTSKTHNWLLQYKLSMGKKNPIVKDDRYVLPFPVLS